MTDVDPQFVPVLEASDIHRGNFDGPKGCHCLGGWITEIVRGDPSVYFSFDRTVVVQKELHDAVLRECIAMGLKSRITDDGPSVIDYNDDKRNSKKKLAEAFNRAMRKRGYTQVSPR